MGVQRVLVTDFGLGENSITKTITEVSIVSSFARITNSFYQAGE